MVNNIFTVINNDEKFNFINDKTQQYISPTWFDSPVGPWDNYNNCIVVVKDEYYYILKSDGTLIDIPCRMIKMNCNSVPSPFYPARIRSTWNYINVTDGTLLLRKGIKTHLDWFCKYGYANIWNSKTQKYYGIDTNGRKIIDEYQNIEYFSEKYAIIKKDYKNFNVFDIENQRFVFNEWKDYTYMLNNRIFIRESDNTYMYDENCQLLRKFIDSIVKYITPHFYQIKYFESHKISIVNEYGDYISYKEYKDVLAFGNSNFILASKKYLLHKENMQMVTINNKPCINKDLMHHIVTAGDKDYLIDTNGNAKSEGYYSIQKLNIEYSLGNSSKWLLSLYVVQNENGQNNLINADGKLMLTHWYDCIDIDVYHPYISATYKGEKCKITKKDLIE